jgi:hypothetical protein
VSYTPWKELERRHAKRMNGERLWRPDFGDSIPDGQSATDAWDCKCYLRHAAVTMFAEAEKKYREYTGKRRFHLVLFSRERRGAGDFVLLRADDFTDLLKKAGEL